MRNIKCCHNKLPFQLFKKRIDAATLFTLYVYMTVVYEGAVDMSDEKLKSAILCACAMVTYAQGDTNKCKTFLFKA